MKIGILNLQNTPNYGAVLVAAALDRFLIENTDYEVVHFDYQPVQPMTRLGLFSRAVLKAKHCLKTCLNCEDGQNVPASVIQGVDCFEQFRKAWFVKTRSVKTIDELRAVAEAYDAGIVGSDQVWRLHYTRHTFPAFFMPFLSEHALRISYAASFGTDQWEGDAKETEKAACLLKRFDAISVREASGVRICRETFGLEAEHVLDPTLLIGCAFFDEIIERSDCQDEPVDVVYYKLHSGVCDFGDMEGIAADTGCILKNLRYSVSSSDAGPQYVYCPVPEWLASIRSCRKLVVTDSFHAICFSLLFEKNFIWIPNASGGNSRIESLLETFGLLYRRCSSVDAIRQELLVDNPIDFSGVSEKLAEMRKTSGRFLLSALKQTRQETQCE